MEASAWSRCGDVDGVNCLKGKSPAPGASAPYAKGTSALIHVSWGSLVFRPQANKGHP